MNKSFYSCDPQGHEGKTNIWLTPKHIVNAIGPFDLDPCACPLPRPWKTAEKHYTHCGLEREWFGRVWLNPPYGKQIGKWLEKMEDHCDGIALVFVRTDTAWFQSLSPWAINFLKGRIKFHRPDGSTETNAGAPSMLLAWGEDNIERLYNLPGKVYRRD